jgi:hypothetical protein
VQQSPPQTSSSVQQAPAMQVWLPVQQELPQIRPAGQHVPATQR